MAFSLEVETLSKNPSDEKPPTNAPNQPTYDEMLSNLLLKIWEKVRAHQSDKDKLKEELINELKNSEVSVENRQTEIGKELAEIENEERSKITSEGLRDGFDSSRVNKIGPTMMPDQNDKKKEKSIEVLNNPSTSINEPSPSSTNTYNDDDDLPQLTPSMETLSKVSLRDFDGLVNILSKDKALLNERTTDALFVEAFNKGMKGDQLNSKQCVQAGLFIQYCNKLGKDGVSLFLQRMSTSKEAHNVFNNDVNDTSNRIIERSTVLANSNDNKEEKEQIQLMAENDSTTITFDVPQGPPPENITLEGDEDLQKLDVNVVKEWLNKRWEIFKSFDEDFKKALESNDLTKVNEYLGKLNVNDAEVLVRKLDEAGILNFSSTEIRDETKK